MSQNAPTAKHEHSGGTFVLFGVLFLSFFLIAVMAQLQTTEAGVGYGGAVNIFRPDLQILLQPVNFWMGQMSAQEGAAAFVAWTVELVYLGFVFIGSELMTNAVSRSGKAFGKLFLLAALAVVIYNGWNDWHFGTFGTGDGGRWAFAITMSGVVGCFGAIGIVCIEKGWKRA
jgi:hypothetical protein